MAFMKRGIFLLLMLVSFLTVRVNLRETTTGPAICLEGRRMVPQARVQRIGGETYVNLALLRQALNISTVWRQAEQRLYFQKGSVHYSFYTGVRQYRVFPQTGQIKKLKAPLLEKEGDLWMPLEFLQEQGLVLKEQNTGKVEFSWKDNYLLGVENSCYQGRPAFEIIGSKEVRIIKKYTLRSGSLRLVCELDGIKPVNGMETVFHSNHPGIRQVRWRRQGQNRVQLIFDLLQEIGVQTISRKGIPNVVWLVPDYRLTDVAVCPSEKNIKVLIKATAPAQFSVNPDLAGRRLEIWFLGVQNGVRSKKVTISRSWLRKIKISQVRPHQVKVVLERKPGTELYVAPAPENPHWLEITTVPKVIAVNWSKTAAGGDLTIVADGAIPEIKEELAAGPKWRIDLNQLQVVPGITGNISAAEPLTSVKVATPARQLVRIEAGCRKLTGYNREVAPDRRRLVYHFHANRLAGKTIVIDPGHGGGDESAGGKQGTREKDFNLEIALLLKGLLEQAGATVICTRYDDTFIGLYERAEIANQNRADLFVSIHANYHGNPAICGLEVYYCPQKDRSGILAQNIMNGLIKTTGLKDHGVSPNDFVVIRETRMPGVLVELGYLSNYREETVLQTAEFKKQAVLGIFQGISTYFK